MLGKELTILNAADTPPFMLDVADHEVAEDIRLKYRYIDLRREPMQKRLKLRSDITRIIRNYLDDNGFMDVETPMLTKATPEGARDYLVPSRTHENSFLRCHNLPNYLNSC